MKITLTFNTVTKLIIKGESPREDTLLQLALNNNKVVSIKRVGENDDPSYEFILQHDSGEGK